MLAVAATFLVTIVALNWAPEERLEHPIVGMAPVTDPQFVRSLGALTGPPLVEGNTAAELLNATADCDVEADWTACQRVREDGSVDWAGCGGVCGRMTENVTSTAACICDRGGQKRDVPLPCQMRYELTAERKAGS